jgi:diguanylate cyclase (GGDEF)-like protein
MQQTQTTQLAALTALSQVDRAILDAHGIEHVVDALIGSLRAVVQCDGAAVLLLDTDDPDNARIFVSAGGDPGHQIERIRLLQSAPLTDPDATQELTGPVLEHPCAAALAESGMRRIIMQPVESTGGMTAVLALGLADREDIPQEQREIARAFADRLGLALANMEREQRLYQQAYYDPLTGLPNRQLFRDRLDHELVRAGRSNELLALLYIDLDQFKHINDTLGHAAGDELLRKAAERLRAVIKDTDTVARLGGDEFVVILPQLSSPESAGRIAERIMSELAAPLRLKQREHSIGASIGVAVSPQDGRSPEELIKNADTAMYRAKRRGRNRVLFYESFMNTRALERSHLETGLFRALQARQFVLHYQPQVQLQGEALAGAEALIRWNTPERGQRGPAEFIPVAEESGLIVEIGNWALNEVCRQYTEWRRQGDSPPRLALNLSAEQLRQREFLESVRNALLRWDMPAWALELEFPETTLLGDLERTGSALRSLAEIGVRLAVDDFGTGPSSLTCLRQFPIQTVKIDRSFIAQLPGSDDAAAVTAAVVGMARSLGKQAVAEGVETAAQAEHLRALGCDFAQGYLFAKPMPAAEFGSYMGARRACQEEAAAAAPSATVQQLRQPGG